MAPYWFTHEHNICDNGGSRAAIWGNINNSICNWSFPHTHTHSLLHCQFTVWLDLCRGQAGVCIVWLCYIWTQSGIQESLRLSGDWHLPQSTKTGGRGWHWAEAWVYKLQPASSVWVSADLCCRVWNLTSEIRHAIHPCQLSPQSKHAQHAQHKPRIFQRHEATLFWATNQHPILFN